MKKLEPTKITPASDEEARPAQKKVKLKRKTWAKAALPGGEIPSTNPSLDVLTQGVEVISFAQKPKTIIVPTVLPGLNRALKTGGLPASTMVLLHGPSKGGKTALGLGMVRSFQLQGHMAVFIDAEHSLQSKLVEGCGVDAGQMKYLAPWTYEETTEKVEKFIKNFKDGREKGRIPPEVCLIIIVDSMTKLVPESELKELGKVGKGYPLRALMNTVWLNRLTPMVGSLPILFVMFAHEGVKVDAGMFEPKYTVKGGNALIYDSSIVIRIQAREKKKRGTEKSKVVVGQVHEGVIEKSKLDISAERFRFVMGKGKHGYPIGLDYCEDVVEEAKLRGKESPVLRNPGGVWKHDLLPNGSIRGDAKFVDWLRDNPDVVDSLVAELNQTAINVVIEEEEGEEDE